MASDSIDLKAARRRRRELARTYSTLYAEVTELFARHDPLGLVGMGAPRDEYEPEVGTILPRLIRLRSERAVTIEAVQQVIHEEFIQWFSPGIAGPAERYHAPAEELLALLHRTDLASAHHTVDDCSPGEATARSPECSPGGATGG